MKILIRRNIFETNSSSTHSITMVMNDDYEKWKRGELIYDLFDDKLIPISDLKYVKFCENEENDIDTDDIFMTYNEFMNQYEYETFEREFNTPNGETIIAFGYYGYN